MGREASEFATDLLRTEKTKLNGASKTEDEELLRRCARRSHQIIGAGRRNWRNRESKSRTGPARYMYRDNTTVQKWMGQWAVESYRPFERLIIYS